MVELKLSEIHKNWIDTDTGMGKFSSSNERLAVL